MSCVRWQLDVKMEDRAQYIISAESLPTQNFARKLPSKFSSICLFSFFKYGIFSIFTFNLLLKAQKSLPNMSVPANAIAMLPDIMYQGRGTSWM